MSSNAQITGKIILGVIAIGIITTLAYLKGTQNPGVLARRAQETNDDLYNKTCVQILQAESVKRGAIGDWDKSIEKDNNPGLSFMFREIGETFTIDLERALIRDRDIAFFGAIADIRSSSDGYLIKFSHPDYIVTSVFFELQTNPGIIDEVIKGPRDSLALYVVTARIASVHRTNLALNIEGSSESEKPVEVTYSAMAYEPYLARGIMKSIVRVPRK